MCYFQITVLKYNYKVQQILLHFAHHFLPILKDCLDDSRLRELLENLCAKSEYFLFISIKADFRTIESQNLTLVTLPSATKPLMIWYITI